MPSLPVKFSEFMKDPVKALLYMALVAIVALFSYLQIQSTSEKADLKKRLANCDTKNYTQDVEMKQLRGQYIELVGAVNGLRSKIETLKELGKIQ